MTRDEAMQHCHAYLDGQLDPERAAEIMQILEQDAELREMFESEREFNQLVDRLSRRVDAPATLEQGIRSRVSHSAPAAAVKPASSSRVIPPARWRGWTATAAGVAIVVLAGVLYSTRHSVCPYMIACTQEHQMVLQGKAPMQEKTDKPDVLARFVSGKIKADIERLPMPESAKLQPLGAGVSKFQSLKQYEAPDGVFIAFSSPAGAVTLLFHPWQDEEPENFNRLQYKGGTYWAARHNGVTVATWRNEERKIVLSVVSAERSKEELLELAAQMRGMMSDRGAAQHAALLQPASASRR